ncbi:hypothetical protein ACH492_36840 [Streptomyces sp. NPDC019443]|uniref:hypothetical protein n=1 Tax=Streptomyces sp. NPDC019443 TaxID=3365061 RepID=UPI0037ADDA5A
MGLVMAADQNPAVPGVGVTSLRYGAVAAPAGPRTTVQVLPSRRRYVLRLWSW